VTGTLAMLYCSIPPAHGLRRPQAHALVYTLVADRPGSNELSDVRTQLWEDRLRQAQAIPRRAIERGELAADTDPGGNDRHARRPHLPAAVHPRPADDRH
jgi:hypothetical protein